MVSKSRSRKSNKRQSRKLTVNRSRKHRGGSPASDRVMSFASAAGVQSETPGTPAITADPKGLNLYQTTGGARKLKGGFYDSGKKKTTLHGGAKKSKSKSKSKSKAKRSTSRKTRRHRMKRGGGGATDFRDTLYSRSVDGRSDEVPFFNAFTSEEYISPQQLINEPNMVANPPYLR
jgi:hypothetical protein